MILTSRTPSTGVDNHLRAAGASQFQSFVDEKIVYADLPDGRGYLRITEFDGYNEDDDSYQASSVELTRALDTVFTAPRVAALRSLIIDVRLNSGGDDPLALQIAARLTDRPYVAYTKQPRNDPRDPSRFGRLQPVTVIPADTPRYTGPVNVLISDLTISAGETFVQALMGRTPAATRIGTTTQGVFADVMSRRLPNGWSFHLGNERYIGPDQQDYEVIGIPPTMETPVFTADELARDQDGQADLTRGLY